MAMNPLIEKTVEQFTTTRSLSEHICAPLEIEDYGLQAVVETSPAKWHLAHTTWFFETFILKAYEPHFTPFSEGYEELFNSYYNSVGEQFPRVKRGLLSRPNVAEVYRYRQNVTGRIQELLSSKLGDAESSILSLLTLGINHEQQHQELFFSDLKYNLYQNPLYPAYRTSGPPRTATSEHPPAPQQWIDVERGLVECGTDTQLSGPCNDRFYFDNEGPRHKQWLESFTVSNRLVTNAEYLRFVEDDGYNRPEFWLSDGWATLQREEWKAPLYWNKTGDSWHQFTLDGMLPIHPDDPVAHISAYEADAYARWSNARLLTEFEWEHLARRQPDISGNFFDSGLLEPSAAREQTGVSQLYGDLWEWTSSAYLPYPGFRPAKGAVGEYNGKFMCNQLVLRGGSCVTSRTHIRPGYRNFFYPNARWQFSGIRLAKTEAETC